MIRTLLPRVAAAALVAAVAAPGAAPSRAVRPVISLSATPAHLTLLGRIPETLIVHNDGSARVQVRARPAAFAFDLYGNAAVGPRSEPPRSAQPWLVVKPRRLVLSPGQEGLLQVIARPPARARPGDHHALVLLSTASPGKARVSVRTRLGVLVFVRVPGHIVRRVTIGRLQVVRGHARRLAIVAVNRGNVAERLVRGQVTITLWRGSRVVAVARARPRDLLPYTRGVVLAPLRRSLRGAFTAVVRVGAQPDWTAGPASPALRSTSRVFRLQL